MTLTTEPGSKTFTSAMFAEATTGAGATIRPSGLGGTVTFAMASTSPVFGRITTTMPPLAFVVLHLIDQHLLDAVLQVAVEREHDVASGSGRLETALAAGDIGWAAPALDQQAPPPGLDPGN